MDFLISSPRDLPKVDMLMRDERIAPAIAKYGREPVLDAVRRALDEARGNLLRKNSRTGKTVPDSSATGKDMARKKEHPADDRLSLSPTQEECLSSGGGEIPDESLSVDGLFLRILDLAAESATPSLRHVINATGAVLHSNMGRAPLAKAAAKAALEAGQAYSSLEYDLDRGERGERTAAIEKLLCRLIGTESAMVVNNNAAAVVLILAALARNREVVVSRGELVEIGGSFRIPDIMEESRAILRETGTTNKTHPEDYIGAISEETAALMKINRSNFHISGFAEEVPAEKLATIAHEHDIPLIYDLGSGCLSPKLAALIKEETTVQAAAASGADVICFSGDKLLGGPQAGIIVGKERYLCAMRRHPLLRAFRCDKMALAALETTLLIYSDQNRAEREIPLLSMALADRNILDDRISRFAAALGEAGVPAKIADASSIMGSGSAPDFELPTPAIAIHPERTKNPCSAERAAFRLRKEKTPVVARTVRNALFFDLRTVADDEEEQLFRSIVTVFGGKYDKNTSPFRAFPL